MKTISKICPFLFFVLIILNSCSPAMMSSIKKEHETLSYDSEILVLELEDEIPSNSEILGEVKISGGFTSRCNKEALLDFAKVEARRVGGHIIKITKDKDASFWDSCHRLNVNVIRRID